jgi:hypothetical protein
MSKEYWRGFAVGLLAYFVAGIMVDCFYSLYYYYLQWGSATTDSIEVGPVKLTLSNATDWMTVFKMMFTTLGTYAGVKLINKVIK